MEKRFFVANLLRNRGSSFAASGWQGKARGSGTRPVRREICHHQYVVRDGVTSIDLNLRGVFFIVPARHLLIRQRLPHFLPAKTVNGCASVNPRQVQFDPAWGGPGTTDHF